MLNAVVPFSALCVRDILMGLDDTVRSQDMDYTMKILRYDALILFILLKKNAYEEIRLTPELNYR